MPGWAPGCSPATTRKKAVGPALPLNTSQAPESSTRVTPLTCGPTLTGMQAQWTAMPATSHATKAEIRAANRPVPVIPAKAGIRLLWPDVDPRLRGGDRNRDIWYE